MEKNKELLVNTYISNVQASLVVAAFTHCPGEWRDIDYIPDYSKFYYILEGEGWLKIDGEEFYPRPGQLFLMPAGRRQSYSTISGNTFKKYWCHFTATVGEISLFDIIKLPYYIDVPDRDALESIFKRLVAAYESAGPEASLQAKSSLYGLLAFYVGNAARQAGGIRTVDSPSMGKMLDVIKYIDSHLSENISVEDLAGIMHFHPNYFIKFFKRHMGTSPVHYIVRKRMEKSKLLLNLKDASITEIAEAAGFNDVSHFSKAFKNHTGFSPTEYRRMVNKSK